MKRSLALIVVLLAACASERERPPNADLLNVSSKASQSTNSLPQNAASRRYNTALEQRFERECRSGLNADGKITIPTLGSLRFWSDAKLPVSGLDDWPSAARFVQAARNDGWGKSLQGYSDTVKDYQKARGHSSVNMSLKELMNTEINCFQRYRDRMAENVSRVEKLIQDETQSNDGHVDRIRLHALKTELRELSGEWYHREGDMKELVRFYRMVEWNLKNSQTISTSVLQPSVSEIGSSMRPLLERLRKKGLLLTTSG